MLLKIGKILTSLRVEAGISQKDLARGLFTLNEYSKIERDLHETDRMHFEALLQRLGKSGWHFESVVPMREYWQMHFHHNTLQALAIGNIKDANKYIDSYADNIDVEKPLHMQSLLLLKAIKSYIENKDAQTAAKQLEKALEITFSDWKHADYNNICLCRQEIQLLLLIIYLNLQIPEENNVSSNPYADIKNSEELLGKILKYIDEKYTDENERSKVLPQCLWLLGIIYINQNNIGKALEICERGIEILADNDSIPSMKELIILKAECLEKIEDEEGLRKCHNQVEALEFLYEISNVISPKEEVVTLLLSRGMYGEIIVTNELIKELREAKGISQEELCENICTRETLSRIESGKRSPNKKNFFAMLKKMGMGRETYYGLIGADNYHLYEKVNAYFTRDGKTKKASELSEELFDELEKNLDRKYLINKQFLETFRLEDKNKKTPGDWEKCLEAMKQILNYSMDGYNGKIYRVPFRLETLILVYIGISLHKLNREEETISLYGQILECYEKSIVSKRFHEQPLLLVYINYAELLEEENHLEESERIAKEGIALSLECQDAAVAAGILTNFLSIYDKQSNIELLKSGAKNCFYLLNLYHYDKYSNMIKEEYTKRYKSNID